jgi:hypothetical protein
MKELVRKQQAEEENSVATSNFSAPPCYGTIESGDTTSKSSEIHAERKQLSPLDYMTLVFNDPLAASARRDHMALAAATYLTKMAEAESKLVRKREGYTAIGKKDQRQERADKASREGIFAVPEPPLHFRS